VPVNFDPLSDVLRAIRLREAVFFDVEANAPWVAEAPPAQIVGPGILPDVDHVMSYHVLTSGQCWASLLDDSAEPILLSAGDAVAFPHGDAHVISSSPGMRSDPVLDNFRPPDVPNSLPVSFKLDGGGADRGHLICGFLGCDARPFNPLLSALPRMMHMRGDKNGGWIDRFMKFATMETAEKRVGGASILVKLGEIMFIDLVRNYLANLPENSTSWLAGLKDRHIGRAVSLLHQSPADDWTLERLAKEVGLSRSSLAERLQRHVGHPPMQYLALWRMQIASAKLTDGNTPIVKIAGEVGYGSEMAFSRAFKRAVGMSPSLWRERRAAPPPAVAG
jgi:AraC-like DNA-binding protein